MPVFALVSWIFFVWLAGWLFFPFSRRLFGEFLSDGGLAVGRILFLTFWTLIAYWGGILGLSTHTTAWFYGIGAALGIFRWTREKPAFQSHFQSQKRAILASETLFLALFLGFFVLRGFWSDTDGTNGEKAMDSALIGALFRADHLPPPNPYAAGVRLQSYYYFGHLETALLTHLSGTTPRWSYNLMCATLPALCFSALFSLGAALTGRLRDGLTVTGLVLGCGTLQPLWQWGAQLYNWLFWTHFSLLELIFRHSPPPPTPTYGAENQFLRLDFFATSRVIPYSINEFPWFTFNQADLHGHYFAFPLALASLALAWALFSRASWGVLATAIAVLGAQILTNTWDFPAYFLVAALALGGGKEKKLKPGVLLLIFGPFLLAAPYLLGLKTAANPPRFLHQPASPRLEWMGLWGPIALAWWLFLWRKLARLDAISYFLLALVGWELYPFWGMTGFLAATIAGTLCGLFKLREKERFLCLMAVCGLLALLWSETTWAGFLGAPGAGVEDFKRQDTVFKFGLQAWFLWGGAAACGAILTLKTWPPLFRWLYVPALAVMLCTSCAVMVGRADKFQKWQAWDAWAHLAPPEKLAAAWLQSEAGAGQNLMEAEQKEGGDYSVYGRFAHATGIPAVIGPQSHSFQWAPKNSGHAEDEWVEVMRRKDAVRRFFTSQNPGEQRALLQEFGVHFIVCGELERAQYGDLATARLERQFPVLFRAGEVSSTRRVAILAPS